MMSSYLLFRLAERLFGVRLQGAIEILPWRPPRRVPLAYSYVEGILDYRGAIYPVFNLAQVLGMSKPGPIGFAASEAPDARKEQSIILLQEGDHPFGITVDSVVKMALFADAGEKASEIKGINTNVVKGVRYDDDQEVILLSFERLFHAG
jgi:chemotaxis signal transduction protein